MSRAKQKQIQFLREQKEKRENQNRTALKKIIESEQTLRISLDYAEEFINAAIDEPLQEYSPTHISRMVFQQQLTEIKKQFQKLPKSQCKIQHFIVIMLRVMKFPFEKAPLYMIGIKDMFYQISEQGKDIIVYEQVFKYIVGELVTLKQQQQDTQFQVHFDQNKKQDYLLHDNGIKRTLYSSDLKVVMSLDERQNMIKFYDQDMRNINRYCGKKQSHFGRNPMIIDFDYSEMTMRLGIIFPDNIIESIHLPNYLNKTQSEFQQTTLNLLGFTMACKMRKIYYLQMLNKWLTISEEDNFVYLYDMEKVRLKPEEVEQKIQIDNNDLHINMVLEIVAISAICFVAGNQITFYNEALTEKKFNKFSHHEIITILKYSEENNAFYLVGKQEKNITIFTINRNHSTFKIRTFAVNKLITDFQIFPYFETILVCDDTNNATLIHESTKNISQHQNLSNIVKMKDKFLRIQKISKDQFIIFQTYMLIYVLDKVAIEREIQYNFLPNYYFDNRKDQFYISINSQIISFSLIYGQIRKNYSFDTSNIKKHECFFLGHKTLPFIFDSNQSLYEIYLKTEQIEGQNKSYKKKVLMSDIIAYFYDEQMRSIMLVNDDSIHLLRNDFNNTFNTINNIYFKDISKVIHCIFCHKTKYLTLMTLNQCIYQMKNFENHLSLCFKFSFERAAHDAEQKIIIQYQYCSHYQIIIILNNRNQIVIVQRLNVSNYTIIKLADYIPYKLRHLNFNKFSYHLIKQKNIYIPSILIYDESGYLFDINLHKNIITKFINAKKQENVIRSFLCESYEIKAQQLITYEMVFKSQMKLKLNSNDFIFQKAHQKQIVLGTKIFLQIITILTISKDGIIKLWNQKYNNLFILKIPSLHKIVWNMKQILTIKNTKSINQLKDIINLHYSLKSHHPKPLESISKNKKNRHYIQPVKKFKFSQDLPLQIQSKEIEDIVMYEEDYRKNYQTYKGIKTKIGFNPQLSRTIDVHPWRNRREFMKIYQKASPTNKYKQKIPQDLVSLRTSLDMAERKKKIPNYRLAQTILPQLKLYQNQKIQKIDPKKELKKQNQQQQEVQTFESCLYIKTERRRKKPNQLDQIDREFLKKEIALQSRRWIPKLGRQKINSSIQMGQSSNIAIEQNRFDTIRDIQSVFAQHNKECTELGRGRIIQIDKINLIKDYI